MTRASKARLCAGRDLGRHLALMAGLVGEHRLADDVADGKDVRDIGAHLPVHRDEAALIDGDAGLVGIDPAPVRRAADRDQHLAIGLLSRSCRPSRSWPRCRCATAFRPVTFVPSHDGLVTLADAPLERPQQVWIHARHELIEQAPPRTRARRARRTPWPFPGR